jgi:hypothetical protein
MIALEDVERSQTFFDGSDLGALTRIREFAKRAIRVHNWRSWAEQRADFFGERWSSSVP